MRFLDPIAVTCLLAVAGTGACATSYRVSRSELQKLNGFDAGKPEMPIEVEAEGGKAVKFTPESRLRLETERASGVTAPPAQRYLHIEVDDEQFIGVPAWKPSDSVVVPLSAVTSVRISEGEDHGKTLAAVAGGVAVVGLGVWLVVSVIRGVADALGGSCEDPDGEAC